MFTRDLCAACTGFTGASSLLAVVRYLSEPTVPLAALLVVCSVAFVTSLTLYASVVAVRNATKRSTRTATRSTHARRPSAVSKTRSTRQAPAVRQQSATA
jgi:hypothetical protein